MNVWLGLKAEILLGAQLVWRRRATRLALALAASLVVVLLAGSAPASLAVRRRTVVFIAGALAAVAGSRLLARGGPLAAARHAAAPWLVTPGGRLLGSLLLTAPTLLVVSLVLVRVEGDPGAALRAFGIAAVYGLAAAAVVEALTPVIGSSAAGTLGFLAAFMGGVRPSQIAALLAAWPPIQTIAVVSWNALPLPWRAERWLKVGASGGDPLLLAAWLLAGVALGAWVIERFTEEPGRPEGAA